MSDREEYAGFDDDEDEDIESLREDYGLDKDEAEEVRDLMDEGLDEEEAIEVRELLGPSGGGGGVGGTIFSFVSIGLLIWGGFSLWGWAFGSSDSSNADSSYGQPTSSFHSADDCVEPENPYDYDTGHYAGWQWGEEGNYCSGDSDSFVEGCQEYESAEATHEDCLSNQ